MQTLAQIREILEQQGLAPNRQYGQNFLIDLNLMARLLDLAAIREGQTVLEVGPGTGSLTEELLKRSCRVVAVEIDRGMHRCVQQRLGDRANLVLIHGDALRGKHEMSLAVQEALGKQADLVANLPYSIATPLVVQCLVQAWRARWGKGLTACRFDSLTFTVQREVADRMAAKAGADLYGPVSVLVALLGKVTAGPIVPPESFWPRPQISSRIVRIDFDAVGAEQVTDVDLLSNLVHIAFNQRRKQMGSVLRRPDVTYSIDAFREALAVAGIDTTQRAEDVPPSQFLRLAAAMSKSL